jgi:hypothetical protein
MVIVYPVTAVSHANSRACEPLSFVRLLDPVDGGGHAEQRPHVPRGCVFLTGLGRRRPQ